MEAFWGFLKIGCIGVVVLIGLFMVLMAMPQSRLRATVLEMMGWTGTAGSALMVASPIDWIPDFIVGLGWTDDMAMIVVGIASLLMALHQHKARERLLAREEPKRIH